MAVYQKVVGDDGAESYVEVDEKTIVETHPDFLNTREALKKANDEAKKLRLAQKQGDPVEKGEDSKPAPAVIDVEAIYATVTERVKAELAAEQTKAQETQKGLKAIADKYKLKPDVLPLLGMSKDPEVLAEHLAKTNFRFEDAPHGNETPEEKFASTQAKIEKLMGIQPGGPELFSR